MLTIDIEITNRCNASCTFCPRAAIRHEGTMRPELFERALARAVEFDMVARAVPVKPVVVFCGTGDPLVNRRAPYYVRRVRESGFECQVSTNGALLTREVSEALLDARVTDVNINASEIEGAYERVYQLPFARTRENIIGFVERARGKCRVRVVIVDYLDDPEHVRSLMQYWRALGVDEFLRYDLINRGGSLHIHEWWRHAPGAQRRAITDLQSRSANPICGAPFLHLFVGYDGRYYLCSSDWKKEVAFGSVFDTSFAAITAAKLARVSSREPICRRCSADPLNRLTQQHAAAACGAIGADPAATLERLLRTDAIIREVAARVMASAPQRVVTEAGRPV